MILCSNQSKNHDRSTQKVKSSPAIHYYESKLASPLKKNHVSPKSNDNPSLPRVRSLDQHTTSRHRVSTDYLPNLGSTRRPSPAPTLQVSNASNQTLSSLKQQIEAEPVGKDGERTGRRKSLSRRMSAIFRTPPGRVPAASSPFPSPALQPAPTSITMAAARPDGCVSDTEAPATSISTLSGSSWAGRLNSEPLAQQLSFLATPQDAAARSLAAKAAAAPPPRRVSMVGRAARRLSAQWLRAPASAGA